MPLSVPCLWALPSRMLVDQLEGLVVPRCGPSLIGGGNEPSDREGLMQRYCRIFDEGPAGTWGSSYWATLIDNAWQIHWTRVAMRHAPYDLCDPMHPAIPTMPGNEIIGFRTYGLSYWHRLRRRSFAAELDAWIRPPDSRRNDNAWEWHHWRSGKIIFRWQPFNT